MHDLPLGWAGRVMQWLGFGTRLVLVNVLFVAGTLAGLVVFGLFPAAVAATTVLGRLRLAGGGEPVVRDFVRAYRSQFWHTNRVGGLFWLAGVVLSLNVLTMLAPAGAALSPVHAVLQVLAAVAGVGTLAAAVTAVAVCSRYRDSVRATWRTAFVLPLVSPVTGLSVLATLAASAVIFSAMPVLVPLMGASLPLLLCGWLVRRRMALLNTTDTAGPADAGIAAAARAATPAAA
ncbi:MAG: hypothetical protein JWQ75_2082 [Pseudarthrobacter sp.]|nr:hypothetical protein [Pseudarthrobacter sp.]